MCSSLLDKFVVRKPKGDVKEDDVNDCVASISLMSTFLFQSGAGRQFLAPPYYCQRTVFASLSALFFIE